MGPPRYSAGDAISYGWRKFRAQPGPLVLGMLGIFALSLIVSAIAQAIFLGGVGLNTLTTDPSSARADAGFFGLWFGNTLVSFVGQLVVTIASAGLVKAALLIVDGRPVSLQAAFEGWDKLQLVVASLLVSLATAIGFVLLVIPGIIVAYLMSFSTMFLVDRNLSAIDAIKASIDFTRSRVGDVLVFLLLAIVVVIIGLCLCGVGVLVAGPVALIGGAFTYRVLQGQPVSPAP